VDSPRPARTQDFAWQVEWLALCESKIAVSLGVVSFLCFVSLDKQRNESRRQTIAAGISKNEVRVT
jgi:hypothetical protein